MNATLSNTHSPARTCLFSIAFAFTLLFLGLATTGCGVVDSNEPAETEKMLALETTPTPEHADANRTPVEDDLGGSSAAGTDNPVKDYKIPSINDRALVSSGTQTTLFEIKDPRFIGPPEEADEPRFSSASGAEDRDEDK